MSVDVHADARRLFQALTMPEYIEAWIQIPGNSNDSMTVAAPEANGFRLDHYAAGRKSVSINSSYLFCHQRKMRMSWRKTHEQSRADSVVDFRLRGNFGSSILELRHLALPTADEHRWHQQALAWFARKTGFPPAVRLNPARKNEFWGRSRAESLADRNAHFSLETQLVSFRPVHPWEEMPVP